MERPLAASAAALMCGIILSDVNISHGWGMMSLILCIFAVLLIYRAMKAKLSPFILLAVPFLIAGYGLHSINRNHYHKILKPWEGLDVTVDGTIYDEPQFINGKTRFTLEIKTIKSDGVYTPKNAKIQLTVYSETMPNLQYGSLVSINGEMRLFEGQRNPGGFNTQKFMAARGISGMISVPASSVTLLGGCEAWWLKETGYKLRHSILKTLDSCLPQKEASVLAGMLIGYTADMPEEMEEDFRRAGLSHVMAVSGANIAFLLAPLLWVLKKVGFNPRWSSALSLPLMIFYVFATGMEASVVRAAIMAGVTLLGMIFWRRTDIYCSMAASAILILAGNTFMLFDMGFILSFLATLSLVVFYKPFFCHLPVKVPKTVRDTFAGTISAQLGVIPVIAFCFNTFSIVSIFSNLLVIPLTGLVTVLGAIVAVTGNVILPAGRVFGYITRFIIDIILLITGGISKIPWAETGIATPGLLLIVLYYIFLVYIRFGHPRLKKEVGRPLLAAISVFYGVVIILSSLPDKSLRICFADVGQGDCIIIRTPKASNIIIDGGGSINDEKGSYVGERIVVPLLYNLNMTEIDVMIATHGHADHIGGLKSVIEKVQVNKLIIADAPDVEMRELTDLASKKGIPVQRIKEGDMILDEDGLIIKALYPLNEEWLMPSSAATNANELSLVTRLDYGKFSALFTGDIGADTEKLLLEDEASLSADILKIAHHGSKYSSGEAFMDAVKPSMAVIQVGRNRYGHPSMDTLDRLESSGTMVYQTIRSGGIMVRVNENSEEMMVTTVIGD